MGKYTISLALLLESGESAVLVCGESVENEHFKLTLSDSGERATVVLEPKEKLTLESATLSMPWRLKEGGRVLLNGFQSWTDTRELTGKDHMYGLLRCPKFAVKKFGLNKYGDYDFTRYSKKAGDFHGFSYGYLRFGEEYELVASLSERSGYTVFYYDARKGETLYLEKDCKGLEIAQRYALFDIAVLSGDEKSVFDRWFELLGIIPPKTRPMSGYTSWYNHYQNIDEKVILDNIDGMDSLPVKADIFQLDDGWQTAVGDWLSIDKKKFPNGLKPLVDRIHEKGMLAGLWLAPFVCETNSAIFKNKPKWLRRDANGGLCYCGMNWSGFYALDLESHEVSDYIRKVFNTVLGEWGFDMVKLDFLYGAAMLPTATRTRGQQMCEAMDFLRECVGEKLILGCGVPLMPAFGKVDFCRIGCDVGLDWDANALMRLTHRERVSTRNAIHDTVYRRHLDKRAFLNDPDVFLLRDDNLKLSDERKRQVAAVNGLLGSLWFTSDNGADYNAEKRELYKYVLSLHEARLLGVERDRKALTLSYEKDGKAEKLEIKL